MKNKYILIAIAMLVLTIILLNWSKIKAAILPGAAVNGGAAAQPQKIPAKGAAANGGTVGDVLPPPATGYAGFTTVGLDRDKLLFRGSTGNEVRELQHILNLYLPGSNLVEDGNFGSLTDAALYQAIGANAATLKQVWDKLTNQPFNPLAGFGF